MGTICHQHAGLSGCALLSEPFPRQPACHHIAMRDGKKSIERRRLGIPAIRAEPKPARLPPFSGFD
jgi:hypothetical protein